MKAIRSIATCEIFITWNTCKEDTFKVCREEICDIFGVEPIDFYITYHAKYIKDEHSARDLPHGAWVSINFRGHGSGRRAKSSAAKEDSNLTRVERIEMKKKELFVVMLSIERAEPQRNVPHLERHQLIAHARRPRY